MPSHRMSIPPNRASQDAHYRQAAAAHARDLARFAAGYERDPSKRRDLVQDMHVALWRSFAAFDGRCSLRTWVYRVAHNVGASHVQRSLRLRNGAGMRLDDIAAQVDEDADPTRVDRAIDLARVMALVHALAPLDREVMLLYLEGLDAAAISEITGLSARNVATKVHRLKALLAQRIKEPFR